MSETNVNITPPLQAMYKSGTRGGKGACRALKLSAPCGYHDFTPLPLRLTLMYFISFLDNRRGGCGHQNKSWGPAAGELTRLSGNTHDLF